MSFGLEEYILVFLMGYVIGDTLFIIRSILYSNRNARQYREQAIKEIEREIDALKWVKGA